jgi:hypothetical protein
MPRSTATNTPMTHYLSDGQDWTHLTATHRHQHNHAALAARGSPDFSEPPGRRP